MTIDEAIARERQLAKEQRSHIGTWYSKIMGYDDEYIKKCEVCAEEDEQLAEWMEELKFRRVLQLECEKEYFVGYEKGKNEGYNKAIDDFVKYIDECSGWTQNCIEHNIGLTVYTLHQIAKQLKEGGKNE